ncbi:MAG: DUF4143 domain-containing protein, partial [Campylobacterota bacterium]|nr:DUF4143 domain-containing protein [Campylobacterota bacterium]
VETFVYSELLKHLSYSETKAQIFHYRTNDKKEIDFIVETAGNIIAIEVKSSQTIKRDAFKHITDFQNREKKEVLGIVFYLGCDILSFSDENYSRYALPLNILF